MKHYEWKGVFFGNTQRRENHIYIKEFGHPDSFTSICGFYCPSLSGENNGGYCPRCKSLAKEADAKEEAKIQKRIKKLEPQRLKKVKKAIELVKKLSYDDLIQLIPTLSPKSRI